MHENRCVLLNELNFVLDMVMRGGTFFKVGGHKSKSKKCRKMLWFELASVTSQALDYACDVTRQV